MKVLSLFSGIGGFDLGFGRAGMEIAGQVEIDRFCNRVLAARWPDVPRVKDVRNVRGDEFGPVDVVCFGSPCQDLSVAGKRAGLAGARSGLFFEATRIIAECRPAVAVSENVPGVLSSNAGRDFAAVLVQFRELGARDIAWRVVNARYAGVPQQRRRVFLVADFRGERSAEVLYQPEACAGHPAPGGAAGAGAGYGAPGGAARSLSAVGGGYDYGANKGTILRQGARIRYLTPLEQERCMGFPDGWTCLCPAGGDTGACVCPDGPRQRALGNAVVVPVAEWIARRITQAAGQLPLGGK